MEYLAREDEYRPQEDVAEMMVIFGQQVRTLPDMIMDPKERLLTANLVLEEALEFCVAMGFNAVEQEDGSIGLELHGRDPDLVGACDAIGDMLVVDYGAANRLGVKAKDLFHEVDRSNKTKFHIDGEGNRYVKRRESDGKVIKPDHYSPADIEGVLCRAR
jgi:predicted HAD superfamily Cof-like phosphohydrolase